MSHHRFSGLVFCIVSLFVTLPLCVSAIPEWQVIKGKHFLVHYVKDPVMAERVAGKAEEYYSSITTDLGFARYDNFWLWENRVKIFIYSSKTEFTQKTGAPEWAIGKTVCDKKEISTFPGNDSFMDSVLPHELTHLVLRDFMGFKGEIPLWLNEGVSQWEEPAKRTQMVKIAGRLAAGNKYIPLDKLMLVNVRQLVADVKVGEFYAQSVSLVGFLIEKHGSERFRIFCGQLRNGRGLEDALRFAYPDSLRNIDDLERAWKKYVMEQKEVNR
ncbi:MAG: peptidase MA family metallohydrolase [Kiritimatiellae bacterium]|nr:peptidase MA family metallohydrolase [Kiritimatiellia bacterium]MDD5521935.1 peptidase MA family metallohydrolase [Kiritimatiellia bacterium]